MSTLLKSHPTNIEIVRYALKILHNLIADDPKTTYSLASARQICLQQANMTELILAIKKRYPDDPHVSTITSTTLQLIASTLS